MGKASAPERIGKFDIVRPLGKGATASVYLARDPDSGKEVAIKLVRLDSDNAAVSRRLAKLFQTETSVARRLDHPNIIKVFDAVVEAKQAYLVMEYVNGRSLEEFCAVDRLLPMHRVIGIIFKCCLALDHAFRQGVIHRDVKPANIMLDGDDNPKIMDFGLAQFLQKDTAKDSTVVTGVGSPAYMSPEQVKDYPLNQKTDLYSLGVVLFQLLTGRLPFRASTHAALIYKIINADTPSLTALNPQLPPALDGIIKRALEKDLYSRYRNGAEFAKDLSAVRYQILEEDTVERDTERFAALRQLAFFASFEDVELWEAVRLLVWRNIPEKAVLMHEGDVDRRFGILLAGCVEVSTGGRALCQLGAGEVVGELAYLHPTRPARQATVLTLAPTVFLEMHAGALALASEELQDRFQKALIATVLERLRVANETLARLGEPAVFGAKAVACDLELTPPIDFV